MSATPMVPHKHAAAIKAWADGAQIQASYDAGVTWVDDANPPWHKTLRYRIKPKALRYRLCVCLVSDPATTTKKVVRVANEGDAEPLGMIEWRGGWREVEL